MEDQKINEGEQAPATRFSLMEGNATTQGGAGPPPVLVSPLRDTRTEGGFDEADAQAVAVYALRARGASALTIMYSVLGFSVLNMALIAFGSPFTMAFGLSITDVIASLAKDSGLVHLLWSVIPLGFYFLLTSLSRKSSGWLITLMVFYLIDGILAVIDKRWIGTLVHGYVLYLLWQGLSAFFAARKLERMPPGMA